MDSIETVMLAGTRAYILAVIEHASLHCTIKYLIHDRDGKCSGMFDTILTGANIKVILGGVRMPHTNSIMER